MIRRLRLLLLAVSATMAIALPATMAAAGPATTTVDVTHDQHADNEEALGMNHDGTQLAAAWNDYDYNDGCGFSYSTDGGSSWAPRTFVPGLTAFTNDPSVPGTGAFAAAGDPAVAFDPRSGRFDVVCQAFGGQHGGQIELLATTFDPAMADPALGENSSYGRRAWTTPVAVTTGTSNGSQKGSNGNFPDHESIAVDPGGTGLYHHVGRLYVTWAEFDGSGRSPIQLAYSDDDGASWTGPVLVSRHPYDFGQDARPVVGPDGTVYVTWTAGPNEKSTKSNVIAAATSTTGGATWSANHVVAGVVAPITGLLPNSSYRVFTDAAPAVDEVSGQLVVAYNDAASGASNVYVTHTALAGDLSSWTTPLRVKPSGQEQFFPWTASAPNGRVDLVFYDRSCDPKDTLDCVTLSSSSDGGASWSSTSLLSSGFDGDHYQACLAYVQPPNCGVYFLGDYIALASVNSGAVAMYTGNGPASMDVFASRSGK